MGEPWTDLGPRKRGTCRACHGDVALRRNGTLREHPDHRHDLYAVPGAVRDGHVPVCEGSAQPPEGDGDA